MNGFQFSQVLLAKRQELRLTQEDIAKYVGVTRAAVSKWEKGLSYPDISLLPKLATFFNISIDSLLGYEPQMTKQRIEALYMEYAHKFANEPFEEVKQQLDKIKNEYYSCYPLLLRIVQLYMNYISKSEAKEEVYDDAFEISERVRTLAPDLKDVQAARMMQGMIYIMRGNAEEALELLGREPELDYGTDEIIITAHSMLGNVEKANEIAQVSMFQKLFGFISVSTETLLISLDRPQYFEATVKKIDALMKLYNLSNLQVNTAFVFYLKAAMGYTMLGKKEEALAMIGKYVETCEHTTFPLKLQGDDYFYTINEWIAKKSQLMMQAPRDEQSIKKDIVNTISNNPVFTPLQELEVFKQYIKRLQSKLNLGGKENE